MSGSFLTSKISVIRRIARSILGDNSGQGSTARSVVWNYLGYVYQLAINFASTAYIARKIPVPEYGLLIFVVSLSQTLNMLDLGIGSVLVQAYVSAKVDGGIVRLNELLSTTFFVLTAIGALGAALFIGISALLPGPFNIPHQLLHEAAIIFLLAALMVQAGLSAVAVEQVYQSSRRFDRLNQVQFIIATLFLVLTVIALFAGFGVIALAVIQAIAAVLRPVLLICALPFTVSDARISFSRVRMKLLRPLLSVSKWAFVNSVSWYLLDLLMWIILGTFGSMQAAAMFGLANKLPKQLWNAIDRGASVFLPSMSQFAAEYDREKLRAIYIVVQKLVFGASLPFILLGIIFAWPLIHIWAGAQYHGATTTMQLLLLAAVGHAVAYPSSQLMYACSLPKKLVSQSVSILFACAAGAMILVPRYGAAGLAAAFAIPNLIICAGWTIPVACKLAGLSTSTLIEHSIKGLKLPLAATCAAVLLLLSFQSVLSAFWLFAGAVSCGCLYLGIWAKYTALPLYRNRAELSQPAVATD
jgi:O-antigen/teichoic acid export membrane protein